MTRIRIIDEIAAIAARQCGAADVEDIFRRGRGLKAQRARSLAIAIAGCGLRDLTSGDIAAQFGRHPSTVPYHAAQWRLERNHADWNAAVAALAKRGWEGAPKRR